MEKEVKSFCESRHLARWCRVVLLFCRRRRRRLFPPLGHGRRRRLAQRPVRLAQARHQHRHAVLEPLRALLRLRLGPRERVALLLGGQQQLAQRVQVAQRRGAGRRRAAAAERES
jgi:hypothetical protein